MSAASDSDDAESNMVAAAPFCPRGPRSKRVRKHSKPDPETITPEEDLAVSLMILSRDVWTRPVSEQAAIAKYQCATCKRTFESFQALGGHRSNHKKTNGCMPGSDKEATGHKCPVCYRVFGSGQALGGHKRTHFVDQGTEGSSSNHTRRSDSGFIDLNFPAPVYDGENPTVSDDGFVRATRSS